MWKPDSFSFTPLQTYKVLKLYAHIDAAVLCFTPLQTYKVLKLQQRNLSPEFCFTPLQTYKVLKRFPLL